MAKAKKKKQFVPIFEDYFEQFNLLSFEQAGRLFALIRCYHSMEQADFHALEVSLALDAGARIIWSFLKSDLDSFYEEKLKKSQTNSANARSRWKTGKAASNSSDVPGQKSIVFTAEQAEPGTEPVLTAHATGMRNDAIASKIDAVASPIYNNINNNNTIHNNNIYNPDQSDDCSEIEIPRLEEIIQFFQNNGSTEAAAKKYYNYYTLHDWKTSKGEPLTDVEESVKRWIARDARFWSRRNNKSCGGSKWKPAANSQRTHVAHADQDQTQSKQIAEAAPAEYWNGKYSSPSGVKKDSFRDFPQREYDYDALLAEINGYAM